MNCESGFKNYENYESVNLPASRPPQIIRITRPPWVKCKSVIFLAYIIIGKGSKSTGLGLCVLGGY